ncbi:MAG: hypothetical protein JSR37_06075 [Verrucomicrobia bacterium]|nr:hypothetical protein [Verrucomicrobiota bacterium]MBS0636054.1 hypothetical protein [Verrucomicrobiota bacterium]
MTAEKGKKILLSTGDSETSFSDSEQDFGFEEVNGPPLLFFRLPLIQWKTFFLIFGLSIGLIAHWFSTSELFNIPDDVARSRASFFTAKESYFQNSTYWDAKQKHFTERLSDELSLRNDQEVQRLIQEMPGEIFISYMIKKLHLGQERLEKTAVFARDDTSNCTLIISKPETSIWPLSIMLALEVEVKVEKERFSLTVSRLRRGTQDIALGLSWTYFGRELESIRQLESSSKQSFILLSASEDL